jgi:AP-1 complex subunit sigma 1/2
LLISRQGKTRLAKWFVQMNPKVNFWSSFLYFFPSLTPYDIQDKTRAVRELTATVLSRAPKMCNFIEWQDKKVIYKRYASLYFVACVDKDDNELVVLEQIHLFVEVLDRYFGNVCELDIIFNFHKAYYILDELFVGGHQQETSKAEVLRICAAMDEMMDESKEDAVTPGRNNTKAGTR